MAEKVGAVMVVGAGISGVQTALDLADSGFKVYLVEKKASIGGTMAQLDKTFPTNDCSMCIMAPKLVAVGRHQNVELITGAEVETDPGLAWRFHRHPQEEQPQGERREVHWLRRMRDQLPGRDVGRVQPGHEEAQGHFRGLPAGRSIGLQHRQDTSASDAASARRNA